VRALKNLMSPAIHFPSLWRDFGSQNLLLCATVRRRQHRNARLVYAKRKNHHRDFFDLTMARFSHFNKSSQRYHVAKRQICDRTTIVVYERKTITFNKEVFVIFCCTAMYFRPLSTNPQVIYFFWRASFRTCWPKWAHLVPIRPSIHVSVHIYPKN
jgi:hypothetical protein